MKKAMRDETYPGWALVNCGCYVGQQWGTGEDCPYCVGGAYSVHLATRSVAKWPGGPFIGAKEDYKTMADIWSQLDEQAKEDTVDYRIVD